MALNERPGHDGMTPANGTPGVPQGCPDAERLAEYAEGLLDPAARHAIEAHLVTCGDCRFAVVETMAFLGAEAARAGEDVAADQPAAPATPKATADADPSSPSSSSSSTGAPARVVPFRTRVWVTGLGGALAAAAALVLIVRIAAPAWLPTWLGGGPPLEQLVASLEHQRVRPVEGRLMGGFGYAPPPSPLRGGTNRLGRGWSPEVTLATANIRKFAEGNTSGRARAALGVALIVEGDLDAAITALERAAKDLPDDPGVHTNLSAAYLARARWFNHSGDWPKALAAADRAIALDSNAAEPYFNRALALEGLEQPDRAARAWNDYALRDRASAWTQEAEAHRKAMLAQVSGPHEP